MKLSSKCQKTIIWLTGYLNIIAFILSGGYIYQKTEDDDVKTSAKTVLIFLVGFTGLDILRMVVYNILSVASVGYDTLNVISMIGAIISVIRGILFVTLYVLDMCGIKLIPVFNKDKNSEETACAEDAEAKGEE